MNSVSRTHYFLGEDPAEWITDVPNYDRLQLDHLYPGIDLEYYGNDGRLEFDFVVAPGAETKNIRFRLDGVPEITLDGKGNLVVADRDGDIILERPIAYQQIDGRRQVVATEFVVEGHEVRIRVGDYDRVISSSSIPSSDSPRSWALTVRTMPLTWASMQPGTFTSSAIHIRHNSRPGKWPITIRARIPVKMRTSL